MTRDGEMIIGTVKQIKEVTIYQKGSDKFTSFLILPDRMPYPRNNFDLAYNWMCNGQVCKAAAAFIKKIQKVIS